MHIIHVTAEIAPIAKVGGLADVVYGLARASLKEKHTVDVILPRYSCLHENYLKSVRLKGRVNCIFDSTEYTNNLWSATLDGIPLTIIEPLSPKRLFDDGVIYSKHDATRFLYFCRASLAYLKLMNRLPDILHLHDWHTAALAPLARLHFAEPPKIISTVHNFAYQGITTPKKLALAGLKDNRSFHSARQPGRVNLLKGGITHSDRTNTVSPTYAQEVLTGGEGYGLERTLKRCQHPLAGILNGIDTDYWNPAKDPLIKAPFSSETIDNKQINKKSLLKELSLADDGRPLFGIVTRLVPQKGLPLIRHALSLIPEMGGTLILLGGGASEKTYKEWTLLARAAKKNRHLHIVLGHNEALSHKIFAASDYLLIPSLFEPCGLTQMIAFRYGTIPIVRATGGLADTVFDIATSDKSPAERNGFSFTAPTKKALQETLQRAFCLYTDEPARFVKLQKKAMRQDFSWKRAANDYLNMYRRA